MLEKVCTYSLPVILLQAGLSKLNEATTLVDELKRKAAEQSALLAQKQTEADEALKEITVSMQVRMTTYVYCSSHTVC